MPTEIKEIPIVDASGKPNPEFFGVPAAGGKGVTTHKRSGGGNLTPEEQAQVKYLQSQAQAGARIAVEMGPKSPVGSNALFQAQQATNAIHQIYNKPMKQTETKRVRVKSADGVIGTLPESQLEQALKAGYSRVE